MKVRLQNLNFGYFEKDFPRLQSGTRHVLLNSLKDVLEKPRRRGTPKEARDFKIDTELSGDLHTYFILT